MRQRVILIFSIMILVGSLSPIMSDTEDAYELYYRTSFSWDSPADEDGIDLCYRFILLMYMDLYDPDPVIHQKALSYAEEILYRQMSTGEINRYREGNTVNAKLMTGLGAWALSAAFYYTGDQKYANAATSAADFLIEDMEKWEDTYPSACDDERCSLQRNGGNNSSSLTSYCWTSPNDLGLVALGIGSVVYYGAGGQKYYEHCIKLADALYDMQLVDGSWYDGYALKIPSRWDRSCHYVTMAMMGGWMAYKISMEPKYAEMLSSAWNWMLKMQVGSGAVYDIWVDNENKYKAPSSDNMNDFLQVEGDTNTKDYFNYPFKTYLGEFSFVLSGSFLRNLGMGADGLDTTKDYLQQRLVISNWYILSHVIEIEEEARPYNIVEDVSAEGECQLGKEQGCDDDNYLIYIFALLMAGSVILYAFFSKRRQR